MSNRNFMLTTTDNPFNPFTNYKEWEAYDRGKGYHTNSYIARIAKTSNELSDELNSEEIERVIDEIVELNVLGIYKKVYKEER